jgi:hypothetical protein
MGGEGEKNLGAQCQGVYCVESKERWVTYLSFSNFGLEDLEIELMKR